MEWCIWVYDITRDIHTQVVSTGLAEWPIWTPDGNHVAFSWGDPMPFNIYMVPADGSTAMERLTTSDNAQFASSFSPDGNLLAYVERGPSRETFDILIYNFQEKSSTPFAATDHTESFPEFSPDGRWIAYCSDEEGQLEVYVRPSSGAVEKTKVSRAGGLAPFWARSGKQIFFMSFDWRQMWAADVQTRPSFSVGPPYLHIEKSGFAPHYPVRGVDISLDDRSFLTVRLEEREPQPVTEMILTQNWFEEIKRVVPTGK